MITISEALKGTNAYPVPATKLEEVAVRRGLTLTDTATQDVLTSRGYKLAKADVLLWLSHAPNITQGGQSYSFTDEQRQQFRNQAKTLYNECGEVSAATMPIYGYKGSRL